MMKIIISAKGKMGIPRFYADFIRNKTGSVKERYEGRVASLSIDLNGVIHQAAQQVFSYGGFDNKSLRDMNANKDLNIMYNDVYHKVVDEIKRLYNFFKPEVLVIAVDGVAPLAKISQQRSRRYITAIEQKDPSIRFDSAAISPGTDFMIGLDKHLHQWLLRDRNQLCYRVIYSSHLIPGEGEHKILDLMREGTVYNITHNSDEDIHLLFGSDADLFMLALTSPMNNIWVVREDNRGFNYIAIEALKRYVREMLGTPTAIEDFVVIAFLLGNDFLPHIISLPEVSTTLDTAMAAYRQNGKPLVVNGRISLDGWQSLVTTLALSESFMLQNLANRTIKHPHPVVEASKTIQQVGQSTNINFDYETFRSNWYAFYFSPLKNSTLKEFELPENEATEIIADMVRCYHNTIEWVWLYYSKGTSVVNLDWYYPYSFAPLLPELASVLMDTEHLVESDPVHQHYHPLQQMLMIFHPKSANLIPYGLGSVMTTLADLYPDQAIIVHDGYDTDWQKDILLPSLEPQRVIDAFSIETIPNLQERYPPTTMFNNTIETLKRQPRSRRPTTTSVAMASSLTGRQPTPLIKPIIRRR